MPAEETGEEEEEVKAFHGYGEIFHLFSGVLHSRCTPEIRDMT